MTRTRGIPKSGRTWKSPQSKRELPPCLRTSWRKKIEKRSALKALKAKEQMLKEESARKREEHKKRIEDRKRRREQNELKNSSYQLITDPRKLKKVTKRQLKNKVVIRK
jgi:hypothetical protein